MQGNYVFCHLITTGSDPLKDEIIEIGLLKVKDMEIADSKHFYCRISCKLPVHVKTKTGLEDNFFNDKPTINELLPEVFSFIGEAIMVSHEANLTYTFLSAAAGHPLSNLCLDSLQLAQIVLPTLNNHRLENVYDNLFSKTINVYKADELALITAEIFLKLCGAFTELDSNLLVQLSSILNKSTENFFIKFIKGLSSSAIKNYSFKNKAYYSADLFYVNSISEDSQSLFYKQSDEVGDIPITPLNQEEVANILGPKGELAQGLPFYEYRPQQLKMSEAVTEALNEENVLLTEAGTGTGKSMAYLIPAVLWAVRNERRVVVSTHTINLQEQLWFKDVPLLHQVVGVSFRAALIKGRQNYLCLRRWSEYLLTNEEQNSQEATFFSRILIWLTKTQTGDRSELNLNKTEHELWSKIAADSENCSGPQCRWFNRTCFVNRAKKLASNSNLIIINHSLLCSDVQAENRILPSYGPLIIDEAHHLENVATDHFGYMVSKAQLKHWLNATAKQIQKLSQTAVGNEDSSWDQIIYTARKSRENTYKAADTLLNLLKAAFNNQGLSSKYTTGANVKRLYKENYQDEEKLEVERDNFLLSFKTLINSLRKLLLRIEVWVSQDERWVNVGRNLSLHLNLGTQIFTNVDFILSHKEESFVYWMESFHNTSFNNIILKAVPIDIGILLYKKLFENRKAVILTSATLTIKGDFEYFKERTGLNLYKDKIIQMQIDSPFNYKKQAQLYLTSDLPNQNEVPDQVYHTTLANIIKKLVVIAQGKTLVLFTSHYTLRETYNLLKPVLEGNDILLLGHNIDGSRASLIEQFKKFSKTVLFGTTSFWEGVDIPGENLSAVIIVKLPFWSPSVPIIEARLEHLARQGKSGFWEFSLPQAVIRFKQGFGRLIRSSRDHGVVIVLDKRIIEKKYGRYFLNSLPLKHHFRGSLMENLPKIEQWILPSEN